LETDVHVVPGVPSPTLEVIGVGFGRTGTNSLRDALQRLGFSPIEKAANCNAHPERYALWLEAVRRKQGGELIDWRPLLTGYRATLDWPGTYFWRELVVAHSEAKVILTVRDPECWYNSVRSTLYARVEARKGIHVGGVLRRFLAQLVPHIDNRYRTADQTIWEGTFGGQFLDREHAIREFQEHSREVRAAVPAERLLVFDVKEGWEPLCAFLDVPVPVGEPFPHVNDAANYRRRSIRHYITIARDLLLALGVAAGVGLTRIGRCFRRGRAAC